MALPHAATAALRRVEILEENPDALVHLPARIDALTLQIVRFREDVRIEISATLMDLSAELGAVRADMTARIESLCTRTDFLSAQLDAVSARLDASSLDAFRNELHEIRSGEEETRRSMRVLHELVIARMAALREGRLSKR